jgi:hypothetical protein
LCFILILHFKATVQNEPIYSSLYIREEKNRDIVFREIINTMETRPVSPKEYFVQEYFIQGITHTRAVIYCRDVLNKGRFVLAPKFGLGTKNMNTSHP